MKFCRKKNHIATAGGHYLSAVRFLGCLLLMNSLFITSFCHAQIPRESLLEEVMEDLSVDNLSEGGVDEQDWEDELEELSTRFSARLNLNCATREQLKQFPFLTETQIEQLLAYVYIHGQMKTLYELQLVKEMDRETIHRLLPYVCADSVAGDVEFRWKNLLINAWEYGRSEVLMRTDIPFYKRRGYEQVFLGPPVYNSVKYTYRYGEHLYLGLVGEKDAGEPFGALHNRYGYDFYSFCLFLKRCGWLKTLAVGNYRVSFGQGLVVGTDYLLGKTMYAFSFEGGSRGIKRYASTDEYNYFRGMAATVSLAKHTELSAFYSHRQLDGVVVDGEISSIYTTGLHRSRKEVDKRHRFTLQTAGGNLGFRFNRLQVGVTALAYLFDYPYEPKRSGYAKYNLHGQRFYNASIDYAYRFPSLSLQGETAVGSRGWASLNRLRYTPTTRTKLMLLHRFYSYDYWALFACAFSEGGKVQNEQGYYVGVETSPFSAWTFLASADFFAFPWKKYRVSRASRGAEGMLQAVFTPRSDWSMSARYRYEQKERDLTEQGIKFTLPTYRHQLRYRLDYARGGNFACRTTLEYNQFHQRGKAPHRGYAATQRVSYSLPQPGWFFDIQGSYFSTDHYDVRTYIPEGGLLHSYYTPMLEGRGFRFSFRVRYKPPSDRWMLLAKLGETHYSDRSEIGTGYESISGATKTDLQMQVRVKF